MQNASQDKQSESLIDRFQSATNAIIHIAEVLFTSTTFKINCHGSQDPSPDPFDFDQSHGQQWHVRERTPGRLVDFPITLSWECSSSTASDYDSRTLLWSVPSWLAHPLFLMLNLHFTVAHSCVAIFGHQNASRGIRDDY